MADKIVRLLDMDPPLPILAKDNGGETSFSLATAVSAPDANGLDVDVTRLPAGSAVAAATTQTITLGGTAQVALAAKATRRYLLVQNHSIRPLAVSVVGTAAFAGGSLVLKACTVAFDGTGGAYEPPPGAIPPGAVSVLTSTTGDAFTALEM